MNGLPERAPEQSFSGSDSPLNWLVLYLVVIALPIMLVWHQVRAGVEADHQDALAEARRKLITNSRSVGRNFSLNRILMNHLLLPINHPPEHMLRLIRRWQRSAPNAFRWFLYDGHLEKIALPPDLALPMTAMWEETARLVFSLPNVQRRSSVLEEGLKFTPVFAKLQRFLGAELANEFLLSPSRFHNLQFGGRAAEILWVDNSTATAPENLGGGVFLFFPELLPRQFLERNFVLSNRWVLSRGDNDLRFALLDLESPKKSFLEKGLPPYRRFMKSLWKAFRSRSEMVFRLGNRLYATVDKAGEGTPGVVLLLSVPVSAIDRGYLSNREFVDRITIWALLGTLFCWTLSWFATAWGVSLRIRLAMLFAIAIILPTSQLILTWKNYRVAQLQHDLDRLKIQLQEKDGAIQSRFDFFPAQFTKTLIKPLDDIQRQPPQGWIASFQRLFDQGLVDNFYFLDETKRRFFTIGGRSEGNIEVLLKLQLSEAMRQAGIGDGRDNPFGGYVFEQMKTAMGKDGSVPVLRFSTTMLRKYVFGRNTNYFLFFTLTPGGPQRAGFFRLTPRRLGWWFSVYERSRMARRKGADVAANEPLVWYAPTDEFPAWPASSTVWAQPSIQSCLTGGQEGSGEVLVDGEPCFYFIRAVEFPHPYRPLLLQPLSGFYAERRREEVLFLERLGFGFLIVLVLGSALATRLLSPIRRVDFALRAVGQGRLETRIPVSGKDEIARMSQAFNEMAQGLQERERMTRFLSQSAVRAAKSAVDADRGGQRTFAVILFSDIRSFTTISERCSAEDVVALLNEYFDRMAAVVQRHHGDIDKYIGDAIMAVFRANEADAISPETLVLNATNCALDMRATLAAMNAERRAAGTFEIDNGVGIGAGEVIAGNIGSKGRLDHTVIGDVVNTASRLEGMSKLGRHSRIIVSRAVFDLLGSRLVAEPLAETAVKGKTEAVEMYEVIELREA